ncbi:MAG: hypothetical protein JSW40_01540, partial [Candidatus Omnitrophota bacterium]
MKIVAKQKKGVILTACLYVMIVLLGIAVVAFMRIINESNLSRRGSDSLQAFYNAEKGVTYAYMELANRGFSWYTHENRTTPVTVTGQSPADGNGNRVNFVFPVPTNPGIPTAGINGAGHYEVTGEGFEVKTYPEMIGGNYVGVVVILSRGEFNGIQRTIEHRVNQLSAYEYFFFFPRTHIFSTATFDGRSFGAIHVNGNIIFQYNPTFEFITKLTAGSKTDGEGYILWDRINQYYDCRGNVVYDTATGDPWDLSTYMYLNSTAHYRTGNATFLTGPIATPNPLVTLPYYLVGAAAAWEYDKYDGAPGDVNDKLPLHYTIDNNALKNLAVYEMCGHEGSVSLFSSLPQHKIVVKEVGGGAISGALTEKEAFEVAFNTEQAGLINVDWPAFWNDWKSHHANDYIDYHNGNISNVLTGGEDWERRFFLAAYDNAWWSTYSWNKSGSPGTPYRVNMEWWNDLEYGTDRHGNDPYYNNSGCINDMIGARVEDISTGALYDWYFLNTEQQSQAWGTWLGDPLGTGVVRLDQEIPNQTLVQDRSQGGQEVDPGRIIGGYSDYSTIKAKAQDSGIYIGWKDAVGGGKEFVNPISDCTDTKQFYNALNPARNGTFYAPSSVLEIDVNALKNKIEAQMPNFNGLVFIELGSWSDGQWPTHYDSDADAVMLVNGERLPDGGLSIVTPNNVYLKGDYNLDPDGVAAKFRDADDANVIQRVINDKPYIGDCLPADCPEG